MKQAISNLFLLASIIAVGLQVGILSPLFYFVSGSLLLSAIAQLGAIDETKQRKATAKDGADCLQAMGYRKLYKVGGRDNNYVIFQIPAAEYARLDDVTL